MVCRGGVGDVRIHRDDCVRCVREDGSTPGTQHMYMSQLYVQVIVHGANGGEISMPEPVGAVFLTTQPNIVLAAMANSIVEVNVSQKTITRVG